MHIEEKYTNESTIGNRMVAIEQLQMNFLLKKSKQDEVSDTLLRTSKL